MAITSVFCRPIEQDLGAEALFEALRLLGLPRSLKLSPDSTGELMLITVPSSFDGRVLVSIAVVYPDLTIEINPHLQERLGVDGLQVLKRLLGVVEQECSCRFRLIWA